MDSGFYIVMDLCSTQLDIRDVAVGEGRQHFMHTISAGSADAPPMVLVPGYGAGAGFYFRNIDSLAQHFRMHAVDLLGTGMSGGACLDVFFPLLDKFRFARDSVVVRDCTWHTGHVEALAAFLLGYSTHVLQGRVVQIHIIIRE